MNISDAVRLLGLEERITFAARHGRDVLLQELIQVRLDFGSILKQAKKAHHPDLGGSEANFKQLELAARLFVASNLMDIVAVFLAPRSTVSHFCTRCSGTSKFRGGACSACNGRGVIST